VNADTSFDVDFTPMLPPFARTSGRNAHMASAALGSRACGCGVKQGEAERLSRAKGSGQLNLVSAGAYQLNRAAFAEFAPNNRLSVQAQVMFALVPASALCAAARTDALINSGRLEDYGRCCGGRRDRP
jgi:NDP-sugar pyrophosphorylase family protein